MLSGFVDCANVINPTFAIGAPGFRNRLVGQVCPPSVETKIPVPATAARTVVGVAVSRWRSLIRPPRTAPPLSNVGELFPKFAPPSTERNSPILVATSNVFGAGSTILTMAAPLRNDGPITVHESPPSVDL